MGQAQDDGRSFEERFADLVGGKLTPGSGNQWYALMDVGGKAILWSLKHTGKKSLSVSPGILREVIKAATGIGGRNMIPGIATDISGESFVVMRADDFAQLFQENIEITPARSADVKRARAKIPQALRDSPNDHED